MGGQLVTGKWCLLQRYLPEYSQKIRILQSGGKWWGCKMQYILTLKLTEQSLFFFFSSFPTLAISMINEIISSCWSHSGQCDNHFLTAISFGVCFVKIWFPRRFSWVSDFYFQSIFSDIPNSIRNVWTHLRALGPCERENGYFMDLGRPHMGFWSWDPIISPVFHSRAAITAPHSGWGLTVLSGDALA